MNNGVAQPCTVVERVADYAVSVLLIVRRGLNLMRNRIDAAPLVVITLSLFCFTVSSRAESPSPPLVLKTFGSFFVGGREESVPYRSSNAIEPSDDLPDSIIIDQMYVQYMIPARLTHEVALVLAHGAWHTGKTWEETPDGREGWATYFTRAGFATYWTDKPWRGRSAIDGYSIAAVAHGDAERLPTLSMLGYGGWKVLRFGPQVGEFYPDSQFPKESVKQYFAQLVPDFSTELRGTTYAKSYPVLNEDVAALVSRTGPVVYIGHSQGGSEIRGIVRAHPGLLKGAVSIEGGCPIVEDAGLYKNTPFLVVTGDYIKPKPNCQPFVDALNALGGSGTNLYLPAAGIRGNDHMMMLDKNSDQVAQLVVDWIAREVEGRKP